MCTIIEISILERKSNVFLTLANHLMNRFPNYKLIHPYKEALKLSNKFRLIIEI